MKYLYLAPFVILCTLLCSKCECGDLPGRCGVSLPLISSPLGLSETDSVNGLSPARHLSIETEAPNPPPDNVCGVNALYMWFLAYGIPVSPETLDRVTPRNEFGSSVQELCNAGTSLGVELVGYECELEDLGTKIPLPVIALLEPEAKKFDLAGNKYSGHYCIILNSEPGPSGKVEWIEGTYGFKSRKSKESFRKLWKGYVISEPLPGVKKNALGIIAWGTFFHASVWLALSLRSVIKKSPCNTAHKIRNSTLST